MLGVKENNAGSFIIEGLDDAGKILKDFWNMVNNRQKVSCNILTNSMVEIEQIEGKNVIVIRVPRAERTTKPVYVGLDPKSGSYRRNGEGDYHCSIDEVSLMLRDASLVTEDNKILSGRGFSVFDCETIRRYRRLFELHHENHTWNFDDDELFMRRIGAMREDRETGKFCATSAGLLMFGQEYEIIEEFPQYFLDYQENRRQSMYNRWDDRVTSQGGDWSGNVFDFIMKVVPKLQADFKVPFVLKGNMRAEDTPLHNVIREAMVNMLTNADFYGRRGVVVHKNADGFSFANPGSMRVSLDDALNNNMTDPRNGVMLRMLAMIRYGERAGSGLQGIFRTWEKVYHTCPRVENSTDGVDRTTLYLDFGGNQPDIPAMITLYDHPENIRFKDFPYDLSSPENKGEPESKKENSPDSDIKKVVCSSEFIDSSSENKVLMLLSVNPKMTLDAIACVMKMTKRGVQKITNRLKEQELLARKGSTKSGEWVVLKCSGKKG